MSGLTISGLASGAFIPLTISFVIQNLPTRLVVYGSLVMAVDILGHSPAVPRMLMCVHFGMPGRTTNRAHLKGAEGFMLLGFAALGALLLMLLLKDPPAQPLILGSPSVAHGYPDVLRLITS